MLLRVSWASQAKVGIQLFVCFPDASILEANVPRDVTTSDLYDEIARRKLREETLMNTNNRCIQLHFQGKLLSNSKRQTVAESELNDQAMIRIRLEPTPPAITAPEPRLQLLARLPNGAVVAVEAETCASLKDLYTVIIRNNAQILFEDTGDSKPSNYTIEVQFQGETLHKSLDEVGDACLSAAAEVEVVLIAKIIYIL